jgi:hypothetical protein
LMRQPHEGQAGNRGSSAGVAGNQEPKAFANSGTTQRGPNERMHATSTGSKGDMAVMGSIKRSGSAFTPNNHSQMEQAHDGAKGPEGHHDVARGRDQTGFDGGREGAYGAGRVNNISPVDKLSGGMEGQQGPKKPNNARDSSQKPIHLR